MKIISKEHFDNMKMMSKTFEFNSINNLVYLPEFKTSKVINSIIESTDIPTNKTFSEILKLLNEINLTVHHNGSQWYDYKIHLNAILRENGFKKNII